MEYLIPLVLVLLLVAGFVTFLVLNATKKSGPAATGDDAPGVGADETPLGDTTQHAGEQNEEGATVSQPERGKSPRTDDPDAAARLARPGEGEGHERIESKGGDDEEPAPPASERLANRDV